MDILDEKNRIIEVQQNQICNLAGESERLRRERDDLVAKLRQLTQQQQLSCFSDQNHNRAMHHSFPNNTTSPLVISSARISPVGQISQDVYQSKIVRSRIAGEENSSRAPPNSISDGCLSDKLNSARIRDNSCSRPSISRQRSFKRSNKDIHRTGSASSQHKTSNYELSADMQGRQVEMLERKYGGPVKTQQAAEIIQYNFRQYTLSKNFERLRNTKNEMRVQRMMSDVSSEKDSVWSDVTITPYSSPPPPPMPLIDVDHFHRGLPISPHNTDDAFLVTPSTDAPDSSSQAFEQVLESEHSSSMEGSFSSNRTVSGSAANYTILKSQLSPYSQADMLHMVKHEIDFVNNNEISQHKNYKGNLIKPKQHSPADTMDIDLLSELTCSCHSSDSGDTASMGSGGYARNQSVSDSRLLNVRVQFNRCSDKERKRQYRIGLNLFNKKPEKGIKYLMEQRFLENSSRAVSCFLLGRKGLSKQMIGEYLGNLQQSFNQDVLLCIVQDLDFAGYEIDQALRKLITFFRLPGEAQKIERIMERFAQRYCLCNPTFIQQFKSVDTVFLLAFAIIMLNTDLHNPNIKPQRKMKLDAFIKNLKGIDRGHDVKSDTLTGMYERIQNSELKAGADHTTQVRKVEETMVGKVPPLVVPSRRLVCYCRLYEIPDPQRKERIGLHQREVFLFNDTLVITKIFAKKKNSITYSYRQSISLSDILVYSIETEHYLFGIKLVSRIDRKVILYFNARNQHDREKFVEDLKESIAEMQEMESMRITEELEKHSMSETNRLSKDSGVVDIELVRPIRNGNDRLSAPDSMVANVPAQCRSNSMSDLDEELKKRHSNGSVDSGMISTSTGSMASREDSPNFHQKNVTFSASHSPPAKTASIYKKPRASRYREHTAIPNTLL